MRRRLPSLAIAALLAFASTSALASSVNMPPPDAVNQLRPGSSEYRIGPQDMLDINVSQLPDMTKTFQVDASGHVLLPLLGEVQAIGRTPAELSDDIATGLKKKYMKDPQVVVAIKDAQSQRVTVDGAVNSPGIYPLTGPTTLLQAVSLAKGPDPHFANVKKVAVFRTVGGQRRSAFYDLTQIRSGRVEDPQVYGNDIVVVDTSQGKSFFQNFSGGFGLLGMLIRPW
jgi:polysaccharide export outer membrane protein